MQNDPPSINLVQDKQVPIVDKFLNWTLTIGRLIIIMTEVVAITAFVYRFSLDDKLVNLHSVVKKKQNIIFVLKNDENKYRNLQDRIALAANFSNKGIKISQAITNISNQISNQAQINSFIFNKDRVNLNANIVTVSSLSNLVDSLKNNQNIKSVSIDNIENKPSIGLSVSITSMLNQ